MVVDTEPLEDKLFAEMGANQKSDVPAFFGGYVCEDACKPQ